ncbi:hypothetical protein M5K25_003947 [Dendrobium thyrsiflorum]|uniref:Uncharacterized protein n=1 Tax=Dendrobium thyrsiflorum TaxID=117978 RepID=A0ABD0VKB2_DENTH
MAYGRCGLWSRAFAWKMRLQVRESTEACLRLRLGQNREFGWRFRRARGFTRMGLAIVEGFEVEKIRRRAVRRYDYARSSFYQRQRSKQAGLLHARKTRQVGAVCREMITVAAAEFCRICAWLVQFK